MSYFNNPRFYLLLGIVCFGWLVFIFERPNTKWNGQDYKIFRNTSIDVSLRNRNSSSIFWITGSSNIIANIKPPHYCPNFKDLSGDGYTYRLYSQSGNKLSYALKSNSGSPTLVKLQPLQQGNRAPNCR